MERKQHLDSKTVKTPPLLCICPQLPKLHSPCKTSVLLPNVFLHSTVLSEPNCWTNFNSDFYFNSRRLLYLGDCLLEWRRAVDMQVYKYPEPSLVTRGSFCYRNCSAESKSTAVPSAAVPALLPHLNFTNSSTSVTPTSLQFRKHLCISNSSSTGNVSNIQQYLTQN